MYVHIKKSSIAGAGHGLFAKTSIAVGELLKVEGVRVRKNSEVDRCTRYADTYKFRIGDDLLIPLNSAGLINHSLIPNLKKVIKGKQLYLQALRPINAGEELFFRYSRYAQKRFNVQFRS